MDSSGLTDLSTSLQLGIGALIAVQVLLLVISLVVLARMGTGKILGISRLLWALIIVVGQIIGSLVFLMAARMEHTTRGERHAFEATTDEHGMAPVSDIISDLYRTDRR